MSNVLLVKCRNFYVGAECRMFKSPLVCPLFRCPISRDDGGRKSTCTPHTKKYQPTIYTSTRECKIRRTVGPKAVFFLGVWQTSIHHRSLWPANRAAVSDQSVPPFQWFYLLNLHQNAVRQILPKTSPKNSQKSCWVHVRCHFHLTERVDWSKSKHGRVLNHNLKFVRHFW